MFLIAPLARTQSERRRRLALGELVNLKITDIDAARMTLRVKQGKGGKRTAMPSCLSSKVSWCLACVLTYGSYKKLHKFSHVLDFVDPT